MNVQDAIIKRRSIRKFQAKEIPQDAVDKLIEALRWAPSARNLQSRFFYFVYNKQIKDKLAEAAFKQTFISSAPLVIVACADILDKKNPNKWGNIDTALSVENLFLQANELGLGGVWAGAIDPDQIRKILDMSENLTPIAVIPIGYPAETPEPTPRKSNKEILKIIK